jgi:hypothetical protein
MTGTAIGTGTDGLASPTGEANVWQTFVKAPVLRVA